MFPSIHFSIERWRKNEEYGVWVSTQGRIRLIKNKEFLNIRINSGGYCVVFTEKGQEYVHRLVAYTWLGGKRNAKYNIDHINSNKRDNSVRNLRWIEKELNLAYAAYTQTSLPISEELPPIPAIERTEELLQKVYNQNLNKETRGTALITLLKENVIQVACDGNIVKIDDTLKRKMGTLNTTNKMFAGGIAQAACSNKPYCTHTWTIQEIKNDDYGTY